MLLFEVIVIKKGPRRDLSLSPLSDVNVLKRGLRIAFEINARFIIPSEMMADNNFLSIRGPALTLTLVCSDTDVRKTSRSRERVIVHE